MVAQEKRMEAALARQKKELQLLRQSASMVTSAMFVWKVKLGPALALE